MMRMDRKGLITAPTRPQTEGHVLAGDIVMALEALMGAMDALLITIELRKLLGYQYPKHPEIKTTSKARMM